MKYSNDFCHLSDKQGGFKSACGANCATKPEYFFINHLDKRYHPHGSIIGYCINCYNYMNSYENNWVPLMEKDGFTYLGKYKNYETAKKYSILL